MRRYDLYIRDTLENIEKAQHSVGGWILRGSLGEKTIYAVIMRDRLIHGYFGVNPEAVWIAVVKGLPPLKDALKKIPKEEGDEI